MTLHEAIELILQERGAPMAAADIANAVNSRKLYSRKDGLPVSEFQINMRVENHPEVLCKEFGEIKLSKDVRNQQNILWYQTPISNIRFELVNQEGELNRKALIKAILQVLNES